MLTKYQKPSSHDDYDPVITFMFALGNFFYTLAAAIIIFPLCWLFFNLTVAIVVTISLFVLVQVLTLWWWYH
jgi:hypothetical protein